MSAKRVVDEIKRRMIAGAQRGQSKLERGAATSREDRVKEIMARSQAERAAMGAERVNREGMGTGETPVADYMYGDFGPLNREDMRNVRAADVQNLMGQDARVAGSNYGEVLADSDLIKPMRSMQNLGAKGMAVLADQGTKGDIARAGIVTGGVGAITASGAALIDLMNYLTQGQQVDAEREDVLQS